MSSKRVFYSFWSKLPDFRRFEENRLKESFSSFPPSSVVIPSSVSVNLAYCLHYASMMMQVSKLG